MAINEDPREENHAVIFSYARGSFQDFDWFPPYFIFNTSEVCNCNKLIGCIYFDLHLKVQGGWPSLSIMDQLPVKHSAAVSAKLTNSGSDEWGRITNVVQTLSLDEICHGRRKVLVVSLHIVLQDQTAEGASRLILKAREERESVNKPHNRRRNYFFLKVYIISVT